MGNTSKNKKNLIEGVKEYRHKPFQERVLLKKLIFVENALTYSSLRKKLKEEFEMDTTRQYLYGIVSGRLTPSFEFATVLCKALGITNVFTIFDINEPHFPNFQTADKLEEKEKGKKI